MTAGQTLPMGRTARGEVSESNDDRSKRGVDVCYDDHLVLTDISACVPSMTSEPIG